MKKLSILVAFMLSVSMSVFASSNQTDKVDNVPEVQVDEASEVNKGVNNAVRLKFMSRRAYQNPVVKNKDQFKADDDATYIDERESKASKRLNRQFRSKRPYINYQFD